MHTLSLIYQLLFMSISAIRTVQAQQTDDYFSTLARYDSAELTFSELYPECFCNTFFGTAILNLYQRVIQRLTTLR